MIKYGKSLSTLDTQTKEEIFYKADIFLESFPYLQKFSGKKVVIKVGGELLLDSEASKNFAKDVIILKSLGIKVILCHGGGPQVTKALEEAGMQSTFIKGQRVTDEKSLELIAMIFLGKINLPLVSLLNSYGNVAIGLSGADANILLVEQSNKELGKVGIVKIVMAEPINKIIESGYIPVIASLGSDAKGCIYNINADTVAGEIAKSLGAEKLVLLTNTEGLYEDINRSDSLISELNLSGLRQLKDKNIFQGGILPKIEAVITALEGGVPTAHIFDGRLNHALLLEIFTNEGIGTMITR
jgi:acetylglutamate kinase